MKSRHPEQNPRAPRHRDGQHSANRLRIIGGRWRSTPLHFPEIAAIRPTPDRVRETLFNWLQQDVVNARCLDLFAGSGALGLEALSRGARHTVFVDQHPQVARYLRDTLARLNCTDAEAHTTDALGYLLQNQQPFDLVFLDPPFAAAESSPLLQQLLAALEARHLNAHAWIYLECPATLGTPSSWPYWPAQWQLHRSKQAGQVGYHLARRTASAA